MIHLVRTSFTIAQHFLLQYGIFADIFAMSIQRFFLSQLSLSESVCLYLSVLISVCLHLFLSIAVFFSKVGLQYFILQAEQ